MQRKQVQALKDEIARLKGEKAKDQDPAVFTREGLRKRSTMSAGKPGIGKQAQDA